MTFNQNRECIGGRVAGCVPLALSLQYFQCNRITVELRSNYCSVFHDISKQTQRRARIHVGKIFARWHLAIAITSFIYVY